jgi:hypothetical protein
VRSRQATSPDRSFTAPEKNTTRNKSQRMSQMTVGDGGVSAKSCSGARQGGATICPEARNMDRKPASRSMLSH